MIHDIILSRRDVRAIIHIMQCFHNISLERGDYGLLPGEKELLKRLEAHVKDSHEKESM